MLIVLKNIKGLIQKVKDKNEETKRNNWYKTIISSLKKTGFDVTLEEVLEAIKIYDNIFSYYENHGLKDLKDKRWDFITIIKKCGKLYDPNTDSNYKMFTNIIIINRTIFKTLLSTPLLLDELRNHYLYLDYVINRYKEMAEDLSSYDELLQTFYDIYCYKYGELLRNHIGMKLAESPDPLTTYERCMLLKYKILYKDINQGVVFNTKDLKYYQIFERFLSWSYVYFLVTGIVNSNYELVSRFLDDLKDNYMDYIYKMDIFGISNPLQIIYFLETCLEDDFIEEKQKEKR